MTEQTFTSEQVIALLNNLAEHLQKRYTPFAFTCDCTEESCEKVRNNDRYAIGQYHTVNNLADEVRKAARMLTQPYTTKEKP